MKATVMGDPLLGANLSAPARRTLCRLAVMDLYPSRIMRATREGIGALAELERAGLLSPLTTVPGCPLWINDKGRQAFGGGA